MRAWPWSLPSAHNNLQCRPRAKIIVSPADFTAHDLKRPDNNNESLTGAI